MASIIQVAGKWRAQVRRKGHKPQTQTFPTKVLAEKWARSVESGIDHGRAGIEFNPGAITIGQLVRRYRKEVGELKPFGRNKASVLGYIEAHLDKVTVPELTEERIIEYITDDRGVRGVTAAIDLTYLKGVLRIAKVLWKLPINPGVVDDARDLLHYLGAVNRSGERDRRPTNDEIEKIKDWFSTHSKSLTPDIIDFIVDSGFRPPGEIVRLRWDDLNEVDKTILIRDRKDPRKKVGNNQVVPLLGRCMDIIQKQPRTSDYIFPVNGGTWSSIFPRACKALKIHDLRLYDLRHEAISRLVESGKYSIPEIMLVSGHKDPKQMMRYTQLKARNLHR